MSSGSGAGPAAPSRVARWALVAAAIGLATLLFASASAPAQGSPPPNPLEGLGAPALSSDKCADSSYKECTRIRYALGPISITPGANFNLVGQEISKPNYDGYMVRMSANMVRPDGSVPRTDELHLHHAVWVSVPQYGNYLPFYGVGEEKTVAQSVHGYGIPVRATDVWLLDYMLHNLTPQTEPVYVIYDIDYVPKASAQAQGIKPVYPLWIDVRHDDHPNYPVFNVQRGYGHLDPQLGRRVCVYPKETCAAFDPYGEPQPGNGRGYDWTVPPEFDGTLIGLGGHVHPGGLADEVSVVRDIGGRDRVRRVFNSRARYFDSRGPVSWDLAMTVTPRNWRVRVHAGDRIRLNAVYDAQQASWYEGMGIVMAYVSPGDKEGVDPFATQRVRVRSGNGYRWMDRPVPIQTEGQVTHLHLPENDNHGGAGVSRLPNKPGPIVTDINIADFQYSPGDLSNASQQGIPRVKADQPLMINNGDAIAGIWHTVTTCQTPCTGATGISYPLANSLPALDSTELGWTPPPTNTVEPVSQTAQYKIIPDRVGLKPGHVYTFFCRIHPFMRGAFEVVR